MAETDGTRPVWWWLAVSVWIAFLSACACALVLGELLSLVRLDSLIPKLGPDLGWTKSIAFNLWWAAFVLMAEINTVVIALWTRAVWACALFLATLALLMVIGWGLSYVPAVLAPWVIAYWLTNTSILRHRVSVFSAAWPRLAGKTRR